MDTFEMDGKEKLETYEWDDGWIEYANDKQTYRVLHIGDSISRGIRTPINKLAEGQIRFDNFATSKAVDNPYFIKVLETFANQIEQRDLILFNNGLHGFHLDTEEYKKYYEAIIKQLLEDYSNTEVRIVLTTHIEKTSNDIDAETVKDRNKAACDIAFKYGLKVIDLYKVSYEHRHMMTGDGVHMIDDGYEVLARTILKEIKE